MKKLSELCFVIVFVSLSLGLQAQTDVCAVTGAEVCHCEVTENGNAIPNVNVQNNDAYLMAMGTNSRIELHAADAAKRSYTQITETVTRGGTVLQLEHSTGWEVGDVIAIASTDFNPNEREQRTIVAVSADTRTITLGQSLNNRHNGTIENYASGDNTWELDMRAEVALLSRNVTIQGDADSANDQFGGHTMTMGGAEQHISGVEFFRLGQAGRLGRYPIHWHLIRDGGEGQYVRNTSVHGGFNKGITIHDTNSTYLEENVVYNNIGHGYFFEDATETNNVLRRNIAFGQRSAPNVDAATIASDWRAPCGYWVTNPNNHFISNTAAGGEGTGIWITAQIRATGAAAATGDYRNYVPREQPVGYIRDFTAHSNVFRNFSMGWTINENNGSEGRGTFIQRFDNNGATFDFSVEDLTLYKGQADGNLWIRGFGGHFNNVILADSREQLMFRGNNALSNSLVLADTATNEPTNGTRDGFQMYDEGLTYENIHFVNYNRGTDHAFYQRRGVDVGSTFSVRGLTFENGTSLAQRYSDRTSNNAGIDFRDANGNAMLDIDGSLFGTPMAVITPQLDNTGSPILIRTAGWNAHPDARLQSNEAWINPPGTVFGVTELTGTPGNKILTRSDGPSIRGEDRFFEFLTLASEDVTYTIDPNGDAYSRVVRLSLASIERGGEVYYRFLDMPRNDADVNGAAMVTSRAALDSSALSTFMWEDNTTLLLKVVGVDPTDMPSQVPDEVTNRWGNAVAIDTQSRGARRVDNNYTGEHNRLVVEPEPVVVPEFVAGDSETSEITESMFRWSDPVTWGGREPNESTVVVIGPGCTVVLDESASVGGIIISGGELLVEDDAALTIDLSSNYILVNNGGLFQAGTEANPIDTNLTVTLEGDNPNFDLVVTNDVVNGSVFNTLFAGADSVEASLDRYVDSFDDGSIASNPDNIGLIQSNVAGGTWTEANGELSFSGTAGGNRSNVFSAADFEILNGFTLTVDYTIESLASNVNNQLSFGIIKEQDFAQNNYFNGEGVGYGIGFNLAAGTTPDDQGLIISDAGETNLESPFVTAVGPSQLHLTITPDGTGGADYAYTYGGAPPVLGNIG